LAQACLNHFHVGATSDSDPVRVPGECRGSFHRARHPAEVSSLSAVKDQTKLTVAVIPAVLVSFISSAIVIVLVWQQWGPIPGIIALFVVPETIGYAIYILVAMLVRGVLELVSTTYPVETVPKAEAIPGAIPPMRNHYAAAVLRAEGLMQGAKEQVDLTVEQRQAALAFAAEYLWAARLSTQDPGSLKQIDDDLQALEQLVDELELREGFIPARMAAEHGLLDYPPIKTEH
jgi:hypothetical protein